MKLPFTWERFEKETGREMPAGVKRRIMRAVDEPGAKTWRDARSIVVAPQMSEMGQTLWQCAEAVAMTRYPDGPDHDTVGREAISVPDSRTLVLALCYAAGLPFPY